MERISTEQVEKIARNINAMDTHFHYIDDSRKYGFWERTYSTIQKVLRQLSELDKTRVVSLCEPNKAKFFGLA